MAVRFLRVPLPVQGPRRRPRRRAGDRARSQLVRHHRSL